MSPGPDGRKDNIPLGSEVLHFRRCRSRHEDCKDLAIMIGSPLGTMIKNRGGYVTLYSVSLSLISASLIYCFFLQDSIHHVSKEKQVARQEEKEAAEIRCDRGVCCKLVNTVLSSFKALIRVRPHRRQIWCFMLISIIATIANGGDAVTYMFYRLQYKIDTETYGWLMSTRACDSFFSQMVLVPFLSTVLGLSDTVLIIIAVTVNTIENVLEASMDEIWFLFLSWGVIQMLCGCMFTCALSTISKLEEPTEIGKFVSLIGLANTLIGLASAPAYNLIYQATLSTHPATALYVATIFFVLALILAIYTHVDMHKDGRRGTQERS